MPPPSRIDKLLPLLVSALVSGVGGLAWATRAGFKADEAYELSRGIPALQAKVEAQHASLLDRLGRIESSLDRIAPQPAGRR